MQLDLSICIINTNNREQTLDCLRSIFNSTGSISLEVIIVDNACTDGSANAIQAEFPVVKLIINSERKGYVTNSNIALSAANGRYLMQLNDDTLVGERALEYMVSFLDAHPYVGVVGANLLNPDGSIQMACDFFPHPVYEAFRPLSSWLRPLRLNSGEPTEVETVCSACLAVRREVINQVGLLDTDFDPIYSDEIDWCYRIYQAGWKIYHLPQAQVVHFGNQTMKHTPSLNRIDGLYAKKALFFRKHKGQWDVTMFKTSLALASLLKMGVWMAVYPFKPSLAGPKVGQHRHLANVALCL